MFWVAVAVEAALDESVVYPEIGLDDFVVLILSAAAAADCF